MSRSHVAVTLTLTALLAIPLPPALAAGSGNCVDFAVGGDMLFGSGLTSGMTAITLEAWVYHRTLPSHPQPYVDLQKPAGVTSSVACIRHDGATSPGQLHFYISTGDVLRHLRVDGALQTNRWYHVVGTWDGTTQRLYLNGESVASSTPGGTLDTGNGSVLVSRTDEAMDGYVDEVRIWNVARNGTEVGRAMYKELAGTETGLIGYWKLNETSGDTAYPSAGSVSLGRWEAGDSTWVTSGAFSGPRNALDFDGSNDYVACGNGSSLNITGAMTLEAWVNADSWDANVWEGGLVCKEGTNAGYMLRAGEGGKLNFALGIAGSFHELTADAADAMSTGRWYHVAATYDGTTQRIYVNGRQVKEQATSGAVATTSNPLAIGSSSPYPSRCFDGRVDEVRVWNVARSAAQIREGMGTNLVGTESGLVGYWRCDQVTGGNLDDWSPNGNHGTLTNMDNSDWVASEAYNSWIGCAGTPWSTSHNWSRGSAPNASTATVGIPDYPGGNDPSLAGTVACDTVAIGSGATLTIGSGARLTVNGNAFSQGTSAGAGTLELTGAGASHAIAGTFGNVELDEASGARQAGDLTTNGTLTLTSGTFTIGANTLTLTSPIAGTPGNLSGGATSSITIGGSAAGVNVPWSVEELNNLTLSNPSGTTEQIQLTVHGTLALTNGAFSIGDNTLTLNGPITVGSGSLVGAASSTITLGGTGPSTNLPPVTTNNLRVNRAAGIGLAGNVTVNNVLFLTGGALAIGANTLTLNGPITVGAGSLTGGSASNVTLGGGGASTNLPAVTLNNLTVNRSSGIGLGGSVTVGGTLALSSGALSIGANTLTLNGAMSTTSGSLTGGASSNITFGGSGASATLPAITLNDLTVNRSSGIAMGGGVTTGGTLALTSGALSVGANTLTVNGAIAVGSGSLTGGAASNVAFGGTGASTSLPAVTLNNLTVNRANGVGLAGNVTVNGTLAVQSGDLDLGGRTVTLGGAASLSETAGNTVKGSSGVITTTRTFNAGDLSGGVNVAGLGAGITTSSALGATTITRGHAPQVYSGSSSARSLARYFDISPATNAGLNATLVFHYDDSELNGIQEADLELYRSSDAGSTWALEGGTVDTGNGTVTVTGLDGFSRWTAFGEGFQLVASLTGMRNSSVAWGDYDSDGDLDLVAAGQEETVVAARVYRNDAGVFTAVASLPGFDYGSVAWGDYDSDGDLDILMAGGGGAGVYRNDGASTFTEVASFTAVWYASAAWADFDSDGDLDVLLTGDTGSGYIARVLRNNGGNSFALAASLTGVYRSSVAWGDYDSDGDPDILMAGNTGSGRLCQVHRNDGAGTFTQVAALTGVDYGDVAWGDYDADGDLDILMAGWSTAATARVYRNDGAGTFTNAVSLTGVYYCGAAWGDYDSDGDLDILLAGNTGSGRISRVYRNDGAGAFVQDYSFTGITSGDVAWGDHDADGDLDVLMAGYDGTNPIMRVYSNIRFTANTAPGAPAGLDASVAGDAATLSWAPAADAETPQTGLSYNLRVGSSPGAADVLAPMADLSSGLRRIPALGNAGEAPSVPLTGLAGGIHYWSVQAVDAGLAGGAWAAEGAFSTGTADLSVTKSDGAATVVPGESTTYTITAANAGPDGVVGVTVADTFPAALACSWTCAGALGGACTASGAGNIADSVTLPAGASVTYTAGCTVAPDATGTLANTATVAAPAGVTDPATANNSATDTDTLVPTADLEVATTDGQTQATPGAPLTYTITAGSSGPSSVSGATVSDTFPAALEGVSWTCAGAGGGACPASGSGNVNASVDLPAGGSVTFTATGTVAPDATGTLANTATVAAPAGVTDPATANNSATDTDTLVPTADLGIAKTDHRYAVMAGQALAYSIAVSNPGPSSVAGATVADSFPAALEGVSWTCAGTGGGTCPASGSGDVDASVDLPAGASVTFTAAATVAAAATGALDNTATVAAPPGVTDPDSTDNAATDRTEVAMFADGFESGSTGAWSSATPKTVVLSWPEPRSEVAVAFELAGPVATGRIAVAHSPDREVVLAVEASTGSGRLEVRALAVTDDGTAVRSAWVPVVEVSGTWQIERRCARGEGYRDGELYLLRDGRQVLFLTGLDDDRRPVRQLTVYDAAAAWEEGAAPAAGE